MSTALDILADEIAAQLESGSASASELARVLHRRKETVIAALHDDDRFEQEGAGRSMRWALSSDAAGEPHGNGREPVGSASRTRGPSETDQAAERRWSWERASSRCTDPELHLSWRAHWTDYSGREWCVRCDPSSAPSAPLTFAQWSRGEGHEEERQQFEADWSDLIALRPMTSQQRERIEFAFSDEEDVDA